MSTCAYIILIKFLFYYIFSIIIISIHDFTILCILSKYIYYGLTIDDT